MLPGRFPIVLTHFFVIIISVSWRDDDDDDDDFTWILGGA